LKSFCSGCFSGRKSNQKIAYFQPLTILEIEAVHKKQRHFRKFQGNRFGFSFHSFGYLQKHHGDVYSEMLHHSIHEEEENESLLPFRNRITLARQPR
jgi:DNA repair protein RecO (recombination protein O)